ncbi:MAG: hypothetical protein UZ17_ACD001002475 [Acidobacteria bacterium OLB17]|nr:MAG: hypothetical protein UZ17_ACD001002475 [Acidobacteria bacterium OLB17]MCZ2390244.1 hypothetical protein [Acidobacteriota bacterium]
MVVLFQRSTILAAAILLLSIGFLCAAKSLAQSTKVIGVEVDGQKVKANYNVFALLDGRRIKLKRNSEGFSIPAELKDKQHLSIVFSFGKYKLHFPNIHISKFSDNWIVGVDRKPFSDDFVSSAEAESIKLAYYILFKGSELETRLVVKIQSGSRR